MASSRALHFGKHVKELRLHLCQKSKTSHGVRDFIKQHYVTLKKDNPKLPILIRECSGIQPKLYARYELGKESNQSLSGFTTEQVMEALEVMAIEH